MGLTPAKRNRLLKTYGPCPPGYTHDDLELFLDLLYGLFEEGADLRRMTVCNPSTVPTLRSACAW